MTQKDWGKAFNAARDEIMNLGADDAHPIVRSRTAEYLLPMIEVFEKALHYSAPDVKALRIHIARIRESADDKGMVKLQNDLQSDYFTKCCLRFADHYQRIIDALPPSPGAPSLA